MPIPAIFRARPNMGYGMNGPGYTTVKAKPSYGPQHLIERYTNNDAPNRTPATHATQEVCPTCSDCPDCVCPACGAGVDPVRPSRRGTWLAALGGVLVGGLLTLAVARR